MSAVREIDLRELAERVDQVFHEIDAGAEYVILKNGRPVARLVRASDGDSEAE